MKKLFLVSLSAFVAGSAVAVLCLPLADPPELVARIAELEAQLAQKSADLDTSSEQVLSLRADLAEKDSKLGTCQGDLADSIASLSECRHRGLPDTGMTKCYNQAGAEGPCDDAICPGQDGLYATGCSSEGRFTDNGDGTVSDNCTGLMWEQDTADTNGDAMIDAADQVPWCKALSYCENLSFAGHDDWRLPSVRELESIVDYGRFNPSIDPVFVALSFYYWSSTSIAINPARVWYVVFDFGYVFGSGKTFNDKTFDVYVRAVRAAP